MGGASTKPSPAAGSNVYIILETYRGPDVLCDATWLARVAPASYLDSIRDPLNHIIQRMVGLEFIGRIAGYDVTYSSGKFYGRWIYPMRYQSLAIIDLDAQQRILPRLQERTRDPELVRSLIGRGNWYEARNVEPIILACRSG